MVRTRSFSQVQDHNIVGHVLGFVIKLVPLPAACVRQTLPERLRSAVSALRYGEGSLGDPHWLVWVWTRGRCSGFSIPSAGRWRRGGKLRLGFVISHGLFRRLKI